MSDPLDAKRELADALRQLLDHLPAATSDAATLRGLARAVSDTTAEFRRSRRDRGDAGAAGGVAGMEDFHERGPVCGSLNPIAPPARLIRDDDARCIRGSVVFGSRFEGGPGVVHGGFLASLIDEAMGMATSFSGTPGVTGELRVRYLAPTPIDVPLSVEARLDGQEGRRLMLRASLRHGDIVTVDADATFIAVDAAHFGKLEARRRERAASD